MSVSHDDTSILVHIYMYMNVYEHTIFSLIGPLSDYDTVSYIIGKIKVPCQVWHRNQGIVCPKLKIV